MAGRARSVERSEQQTGDAGGQTQAQTGPEPGPGDDVRTIQPTGGTAEGHRSATLNLPFVTAQFRAPEVHLPSRDELAGVARGARSWLPSKGPALFYGGLAVTAVIGAIEWPVAAAIGVGTALASRGAANPEPRGDPRPAEAGTADAGGSEQPST
jgi:hypothetical protein